MESMISDVLDFECHVSSGDSQFLSAESFEDPNDSDSMPVFFTPNEKPSGFKTVQEVATVDTHHISGGDSSDLSPKDGSESSSPLSCDSGSADFYSVQQRLSPYSDSYGKGFRKKLVDQETEVPVINEKLRFIQEEKETREDLLDRISKYEDEQKVLNQKLKFSEEEVYHLQCKLRKSESLTGSVQVKLDSTLDDIVKKTEDLNFEKGRASQLQTRLTKLETELEVSDSAFNAVKYTLEKEKDFYLSNWNALGQEVNKSKDELDTKRAELQLIIERYAADTSAQNHEIAELVKALEHEARERDYEKRSFDDRELNLQDDIHALKVENAKKCECLNKELDLLKLKHDTAIAENDNLIAELQNVTAQRSSQNTAMRHMEEQVCQLTTHGFELINEANSARKLVDELTLSVQVLEKVVEGQRALISDAAEKKKEAIRQLCLALEHYRGLYHELRLAFCPPRLPAGTA